MPKVMKASEVRVPKTFRVSPKTLDVIEVLKKKEGLSQSKIIDMAINLLEKELMKS
ncbi:hypothetical protein [Priestia megaterium]|uniref:hypothetical protein n=1 Tax=Priestia megaterium TaxID=1404 RepID=UPI001374E02A|nr:hypothetical protein [Priestia megaterium]